MWRDLVALFAGHDALLCPSMALPAPLNELADTDFERIEDGRLHGLDMTCIFNMVGQAPALSVPMGMTRAGLPTSAQIIARRFDDPTALRIGRAIEVQRPWRAWTPEVLA
jgi:Asp-tRNA(Asn)/Glu-tRNA(Gln) amidotransferase A subunit family amidase